MVIYKSDEHSQENSKENKEDLHISLMVNMVLQQKKRRGLTKLRNILHELM
jgi:hypothetical protein